MTVFVTLVAFALASALGLGLAVCVLSGSALLRNAARFYIEVMRGLPILVLLLYIAFVAAPALVAGWNALARPLGLPESMTRDLSLMWRAILALAFAYAAFIAEVFRAGIQSVPAGQVEAARALGLSGWQRFRLVVFPQAIRTILPPLGNDFVALVKDSSLVSVLGVADITQLGKVYAAGSFRYFETYNVVAFLYLTMTLGLSLASGRSSGGCGGGRGERARAGNSALLGRGPAGPDGRRSNLRSWCRSTAMPARMTRSRPAERRTRTGSRLRLLADVAENIVRKAVHRQSGEAPPEGRQRRIVEAPGDGRGSRGRSGRWRWRWRSRRTADPLVVAGEQVGFGGHSAERRVAAGADARVGVGADVGEDLPAAGALLAVGERRDHGDAGDVVEGEGAGRGGVGGSASGPR